MTRIANVQCNVAYGDPDANSSRAIGELLRLSKTGIDLVVFPEAFLTGYCVDSRQEAERIAIDLEDRPQAIERVQNAADELGVVVIMGAATRSAGELHNSALLFEPGSPLRVYHKAHLPELGLDNFVAAGDELPVYDTKIGRIGMLVCFDVRFPEASRILALAGADLIVLPTNWPTGAEISADVLCVARAAENRVAFVASNRVGVENGFRFIGRSKIIDHAGRVLAGAADGEVVLTAEVDLAASRIKRIVTIPGKHETTVFESRRPELYGELVEPRP